MTFVVAATGTESIWLLADRRLSVRGRPPKDDGRKVMLLETTDGVAILGYAGLGATARGTEPADWMSAVLRGRNLPLEQSLGVLAQAMQRKFPRYLIQMPRDQLAAHHVIVPAFVGREQRLYSIDLILSPDRKSCQFRYTRHVLPSGATPQLGVGGSSTLRLVKDDSWMRNLLRVVRANARGNASTRAVADHLAILNRDVAAIDQLVGSRCIVAWRFRKGGFHKSGGGQAYYTDLKRDRNAPALPTIARGMDLRAFVGAIMPRITRHTEAWLADKIVPDWDKDEVNAELACLPNSPDETLR